MTEIKIKDFHASCEMKSGLVIELRRIADAKELKRFKLIPIGNDAYFHFGRLITEDPLRLPKLYSALTHLTGESDNWYDEYKGSFSFRFELNVTKNGKESRYMYQIFHYRTYVEFSLYQVVSQDDPRNSKYISKPDDELFSDDDICITSLSLCSFWIKNIEEKQYIPQPFVKFADSNLLLFGYHNGEYFLKSYDKSEDYKENKKLLQEEIK